MKASLHTSLSVQQALERVESGLTKDKFLFTEEEATYVVQYSDNKAVKRKNFSRFWSRRELGDKYPVNFSIVMEGTLEEEGKGTVVNVEVIEYHHGRPHTYGGARAIEEYFDKL
ncbi:MAG: hypothetical protein HYX82_03995, partial [Chloroflexi bacterium]|nr:hypothetical protein [Chloroflexota bacterium]